MLAFIDQIVIPFLNSLYGAVGYVGVLIAMAIESAMVPLPSELILPYAGFLVSDPSKIEPLTKGPWGFWIVVVAATIGNTIGSLIAYAIGAWGGRPFLERWGKYLLIRHHEIELAERFFDKYGARAITVKPTPTGYHYRIRMSGVFMAAAASNEIPIDRAAGESATVEMAIEAGA